MEENNLPHVSPTEIEKNHFSHFSVLINCHGLKCRQDAYLNLDSLPHSTVHSFIPFDNKWPLILRALTLFDEDESINVKSSIGIRNEKHTVAASIMKLRTTLLCGQQCNCATVLPIFYFAKV